MKANMKILYLAPVYYDDMKQRPQQIAECLAKRHEVIYIEPTISFVRWLLKGGRSFTGKRRRYGSLKIIRLNGALTLHKSMDILDICGINSWSEFFQMRRMLQKCDIVWVGYSGWYPLIRHIRHKTVIFDKMDEEDMLASSGLLKLTLKKNKRKLADRADVVFVTSWKFYREFYGKNKNVYLIPNAVSDNFVSQAAEKNILYGKVEKVRTFGYIGTIGSWFDKSVIDKLLELDVHYEILLVGRNYLPKIVHPRVHYLGVRNNEELPGIIQAFDVCLYNFRQGALLDTINPVKIYEYLSLNKPVLAVESRETLRLQDYVILYKNAEEISAAMHKKMKRPFSDPNERRRFLAENSWTARTDRIEEILREEISKKYD